MEQLPWFLPLLLLPSTLFCSILQDLSDISGPVFLQGQPVRIKKLDESCANVVSQGYEDRRKVMNAACTAQPAVITVPQNEQVG